MCNLVEYDNTFQKFHSHCFALDFLTSERNMLLYIPEKWQFCVERNAYIVLKSRLLLCCKYCVANAKTIPISMKSFFFLLWFFSLYHITYMKTECFALWRLHQCSNKLSGGFIPHLQLKIYKLEILERPKLSLTNQLNIPYYEHWLSAGRILLQLVLELNKFD